VEYLAAKAGTRRCPCRNDSPWNGTTVGARRSRQQSQETNPLEGSVTRNVEPRALIKHYQLSRTAALGITLQNADSSTRFHSKRQSRRMIPSSQTPFFIRQPKAGFHPKRLHIRTDSTQNAYHGPRSARTADHVRLHFTPTVRTVEMTPDRESSPLDTRHERLFYTLTRVHNTVVVVVAMRIPILGSGYSTSLTQRSGQFLNA
jgi:hypothetical protein